MPGLNKLEKLKIKVYYNIERSGVPAGVFEVMFNPESYALSYNNEYGLRQGINTSGTNAKYKFTTPKRLSLKLIIDGTGTTVKGVQDVSKEVEHFLDLTFYMDGRIHEPKFLKIEWGTLIFKCRLQNAEVRHTLFDRAGKPLRAELDTVFVGDMEEGERQRKENKTSPDLTHRRIVKAHDTLPLLCKEIYGTPKYYIQVAKANKLLSIRNLTPGQELFFPPIEK